MTPILARTLAAIAVILALIIHADLKRIHADLAGSAPTAAALAGSAR